MTAQEKIEKLLIYLNINAKLFSEKLGYMRPQIIYDIQKGKTKRISEELANKIASVFPNISKSWLLADEGTMLKDKEISIHGNNNFTGTNVGNTFNFSLPPQGFQKIIDSNGNVEIYQSDSNILKELSELKNDITLLRREIEYLNEKVKLKDEMIETLRMTLERFHSNSII